MLTYKANAENLVDDSAGKYFIPYPHSARHVGEVKIHLASDTPNQPGRRVSVAKGKPQPLEVARNVRAW